MGTIIDDVFITLHLGAVSSCSLHIANDLILLKVKAHIKKCKNANDLDPTQHSAKGTCTIC
jgi:hypothetical protein